MSEERWISAEVECVVCGNDWWAVVPAVAPALECPECGYMNESEMTRIKEETGADNE